MFILDSDLTSLRIDFPSITSPILKTPVFMQDFTALQYARVALVDSLVLSLFPDNSPLKPEITRTWTQSMKKLRAIILADKNTKLNFDQVTYKIEASLNRIMNIITV